MTSPGLKAYLEDMKARGVSAQTFNKRLAGAKKRIRQLFDRNPEGLDLAKRVRFEEALRGFKAQKIATQRVDRDAVPIHAASMTLPIGVSPLMLSFALLISAAGGTITGWLGARKAACRVDHSEQSFVSVAPDRPSPKTSSLMLLACLWDFRPIEVAPGMANLQPVGFDVTDLHCPHLARTTAEATSIVAE